MLSSIEDGHIENLILYGLRGTGKTVLMEEFNKICITNNFLPIKRLQFSRKYCDPSEFAKALKYDAKTAVETFSKLRWVKGKITAAISYIKPKEVGVPDLFYYQPSYSSSAHVPFEDHLKEYLSKNWRVFENSRYKGVIFLLDEFHTVVDVQRDHTYVLSDFLGALNDMQKDGCKYFVVLSGLPNLQLNVKKARSYSERMYRSMEAGNLGEEDARLAIAEPLKKSTYKFETALVNELINETGQYPYFIQFYCEEVINNVNKTNISLEYYRRIHPIIIKQLDDDFFNPRIELLSDEERRVIFAMAEITLRDMPFSAIQKKTKMKRYTLSKYLERLEEKGLVYNYKRGIYRFSVPLLREFLRRKLTM